jgi:gamma-glutamyltranspeptidase/glutathione hydrolase
MNRRRLFVFTAALLVGCGASRAPTPQPLPAPAVTTVAASASSVASPAEPSVPKTWPFAMHAAASPSAHGAVVSDCAQGTKAGLAMLEAGGNAVDAAVTTAFVLAVAYPTAGNLGGGGFAVARFGADDLALDFRETAPAAATRDMYVAAGTGGGADAGAPGANAGGSRDAGAPAASVASSRDGWRSSGTPASVAGLWALHKAKGSKPWKDVVAPAIAMARDGLVVDDAFASEIDDLKKRLEKDPVSSALFLPGGAPPKVGSTWRNPDLARILERIAEKGPSGFYEGPTAEAIASEMKAHGGLITLEDLRRYEAKWRAPLAFDYHGTHVVAMPPPSSGGVTLAMIAHILEPYDLERGTWHSASELHFLFEAMRRAFAARNARLGDPDFVQNPLDELLSPAWAEAQRKTISPEHATPSSEIPSVGVAAGGPHTTNLSVVDASGNAVALTTTINWFFGSGITVAGTGIVLNNEMDDFASVPGRANGFGLVQGEPNAIAPNKRMLSSMSPIVVVGKDGKPSLVTGAAGGPRIITATLEVLLNTVDHGFDPVAAVNGPRFHMQHLPDLVLYEKDGLEPGLRDQLTALGYSFKEAGHLADANAIGRVPGGWIAAPEPRRKGSLGLGW